MVAHCAGLIAAHHDPAPLAGARGAGAVWRARRPARAVRRAGGPGRRSSRCPAAHTPLREGRHRRLPRPVRHHTVGVPGRTRMGRATGAWIAHVVDPPHEEIAAFAAAGVAVAHLVAPDLRMGWGLAPPAFLDAGVTVGFGTGWLGVQRRRRPVRRPAARAPRASQYAPRRPDPVAHRPRPAAAGDRRLGRLPRARRPRRAGRRAWPPTSPRGTSARSTAVGVHDPVAGLLLTGLSSAASLVVVDGEVLVEGGRPARLDPDQIAAEARRRWPAASRPDRIGLGDDQAVRAATRATTSAPKAGPRRPAASRYWPTVSSVADKPLARLSTLHSGVGQAGLAGQQTFRGQRHADHVGVGGEEADLPARSRTVGRTSGRRSHPPRRRRDDQRSTSIRGSASGDGTPERRSRRWCRGRSVRWWREEVVGCHPLNRDPGWPSGHRRSRWPGPGRSRHRTAPGRGVMVDQVGGESARRGRGGAGRRTARGRRTPPRRAHRRPRPPIATGDAALEGRRSEAASDHDRQPVAVDHRRLLHRRAKAAASGPVTRLVVQQPAQLTGVQAARLRCARPAVPARRARRRPGRRVRR